MKLITRMMTLLSFLIMFQYGAYAANNSIYVDQIGDGTTISLTQTGSGNQIGSTAKRSSFTGNNNLNLNNLEISSFTNYIVGISDKLYKNEFTQRLNLHKSNKTTYSFVTHSYNSSLLRKITDNNMLGFGIGHNTNYSRLKLNTSWGLIYGRTLFFNDSVNYKLRHSMRIKLQYKGDFFNFSFF